MPHLEAPIARTKADAGGGHPAAAACLINARGITLHYGAARVLDGVDVAVHAGEILTIIGPNGAGKTTLLKIMLRLLPPSAGTVWQRPGLKIGYLPQRLVIDPVMPLTVARLMTLTARQPWPLVLRRLAETGVAHLADAAVHSLSGGELQRVLLARALSLDPALLVLDEPVQGVDFAGEAALYQLIGDIRRQRGCGVVMVSHDLHMVMAATDRVICLNRHVCCAGPAEAVGRHPEYARLFGPGAADAFAVYAHHHRHVHTLSGEVVAHDSHDCALQDDHAADDDGVDAAGRTGRR
jgi:zinc transport system ATP-binding protein